MIIDEKGLTRAVKTAWRLGGYTVMGTDDMIMIWTQMWRVKCTWAILPRKVLGTIVEHIGFMPAKGEALKIQKDRDPQTVIMDIVRQDMEGWDERTGDIKIPALVRMTYKDVQLIQTEELEVYGISTYMVDIVEEGSIKDGSISDGDRTGHWSAAAESVDIRLFRPSGAKDDTVTKVWRALESVDLIGAPEE